MHDTYPTQYRNEKEPILPDLEFIQGLLYDTSCLRQFQVRDNENGTETPLRNRERFRLLSDLAKDGPLEEVLNLAGYHREDGDFDDDSIKLVRIGMMTPNAIESQSALIQCDRRNEQRLREDDADQGDEAKKAEVRMLLKELTDYNDTLKEVINTYPLLGATKLATFLQGDAMGMDLPEGYRKQSEIQINRAVNGARSEIIFERTLLSPIMRDARITYHPTSTQEDVWGVDCVADVAFGSRSEPIVVHLPIDVKSTSRQVDTAAKSNRSLSVEFPAYAIKDNAVIMWCGVDLRQLYDKLLPSDERIEENARKMAPILRTAARNYYNAGQKGFVVPYDFPVAV